jgi:hypothetical protein
MHHCLLSGRLAVRGWRKAPVRSDHPLIRCNRWITSRNHLHSETPQLSHFESVKLLNCIVSGTELNYKQASAAGLARSQCELLLS